MALVKRKRALAVLGLLCLQEDEPRKKRTCWVKSWLRRREEKGVFTNLMEELRLEDPESYRRYLRMNEDTFAYLVKLIEPAVKKKDTNFRKSITVAEKLAVTLRFLATGESQWSLSLQFRVAQPTISVFIEDVCSALYDGLQTDFLSLPRDEKEWKKVAAGFESTWNFPNCLGAIDGKHVAIAHPPHSGSTYYNYKNFFSVILMAVVDHDLNFLFVDVGCPGRYSDGGVWSNTTLSKAIISGEVKLPNARQLTDHKLNYCFVADEAFPLKTYILRPYPGEGLTNTRRIFNYRLSRARRIVENSFGVLANTWAILQRSIPMRPERVGTLLMCICALHNLLRSKSSTRNIITPTGSLDQENVQTGEITPGMWRENAGNNLVNLNSIPGQRASEGAIQNRETFANYFTTSGSVSWQDKVLSI